MTAKIYAEGGGPGQFQDVVVRGAWKSFFVAAGLAGRLPRVVRCRGRQQAYDMFVDAMASRRPEELPFLLVDSEAAVASGRSSWAHLQSRDGWSRPAGATDDHAFLMVQVMETWIVADRQALREFFGQGLRENNLPARPDLEVVLKRDVFKALEAATAGCSRQWNKGHSFGLLARLQPSVVEQRCPSAKRLLDRLRSL